MMDPAFDIGGTKDQAAGIIARLEKLRRPHLVVEDDCWYSCPKSGECCNDAQRSGGCNCGADSDNAELDAIIELLRRL